MKNAHVFALLVLMEVAGCQQSPRPTSSAPASASAVPPARVAAADALERLDTRKPVPLLPMMAHHQKENMREHLEVVQEVVAAAALRDFGKVAAAATKIGYSETMGRMCEHMGAGAPGFTEQALAFHRTADGIVAAAKREDQAAVLTALGQTLTACTGCHATYKQRLVDDLP